MLRPVKGGFQTDFVDYALQRLLEQGVPGDQISRSTADVSQGEDFFSLTAHEQRNQPEGRNGFIAVINA
jgi:hypothetical protein